MGSLAHLPSMELCQALRGPRFSAKSQEGGQDGAMKSSFPPWFLCRGRDKKSLGREGPPGVRASLGAGDPPGFHCSLSRAARSGQCSRPCSGPMGRDPGKWVEDKEANVVFIEHLLWPDLSHPYLIKSSNSSVKY